MTTKYFLVPLDVSAPCDWSEPSASALDYAIELADKCQAHLTLLHVIQPSVIAMEQEESMGLSLETYIEQRETEMRQMMEDYAWRVYHAGLECDIEVVYGVPCERILALASAKQVDLIVMGTHGRTGLRHFFWGSVAEEVVRRAPCPVLVTHAPAPTPA